MNTLQQQARFDDFLHEFNTSPRSAPPRSTPPHGATIRDLNYPFHDREVLVTACGRICLHRKKVNISTVLAGQRLGIKEVDEGIWLVTFIDL